MGANAQTSVPTFTAGEILTAANMNISARTGIPVFADATARDAAFGGTGEKTLAEGQFAYLESTNATQYYDGAAWQAVGTSSGLILISATTVGTAVASVTVSNAFSATYDNYKIVFAGGSSSTNAGLVVTLGATATGYYMASVYGDYSTGVANAGVSNGTGWTYLADAPTINPNVNFDLIGPFLSNETLMYGGRVGATTATYASAGYLNNTTSYTAFTFTTSTGTLTGGTIRVYGYANS